MDAQTPQITPVRQVKVCRVGCDSPLCWKCGGKRAGKLSRKLKPVLATWDYIQAWTLTFDAGQFPDQRAIYEYAKEKRILQRLIRALVARGLLEHHHYWWAAEFQMGTRKGVADGSPATEQVHFHVFLSPKGGYLDKHVVQELWGRLRPPDAPPPPNPDIGLGVVWYDEVQDADVQIKYACKYLSKGAKEGVPEWYYTFLDDGHHPVLHGQSRGFWDQVPRSPRRKRSIVPREVTEEQFEKLYVQRMLTPRVRKTHREKQFACGNDANLFEVVTPPDVDGVKQRRIWKWKGKLPVPYVQVADWAGSGGWSSLDLVNRNSFNLRPMEVNQLWAAGLLPDGPNGGCPVSVPLVTDKPGLWWPVTWDPDNPLGLSGGPLAHPPLDLAAGESDGAVQVGSGGVVVKAESDFEPVPNYDVLSLNLINESG